MGETSFSRDSMVLYGGILFMAAIAYTLLLHAIVRVDRPFSSP